VTTVIACTAMMVAACDSDFTAPNESLLAPPGGVCRALVSCAARRLLTHCPRDRASAWTGRGK